MTSAVWADQTGLGTHRDPLAYELPDGSASPQGTIGLRDAAECGLPTGSPNCQDWSRTLGTAGRSSDLVGIAALGGDDFKVADNFTVTSAQTLTSICFYGFYVSTTNAPGTNGAPVAGAEAFRLRVYGNTGGASPGIPDSSNIIKEWTVGANAGYGLSVDPNTTLTRTVTGTGTRAGVFAYNVALTGAAQLSLNPGCYWLEIVGATDGIPEGARLRLVVVNTGSPANDGVVYQGVNSADFSYVDLIGGTTAATDAAFCLSFALETNACSIPAAPTNNSCATAQVVSAPFSAPNVSTLRSLTTVTPFCGFNPVNGNALWYKVTGDGSTYTASSCGANTNFDTVINVYCGACGALNCVANNDTAAACGATTSDASEVSWDSVMGQDYYIAVFGFELDAGFLDFSLTSAPGPGGVPCVSDRCPVALPAVVETDACGASTNSAALCNGGTGGSFMFGVPFGGTIYNLGTTRDFDFWEAGEAVPDSVGDGTAWLDVMYSVEFPGIFNFFAGPCAGNNGGFLGGAFANYLDGGPACPRDPAARVIQLQTLAGESFRLNLLPVDFGGVPCGADNNYSLTVTVSQVRACCIPATACFLTVEADCTAQGGSYLATATTCGPTDPCTAPVTGACCRGSTCSVDTAANCTGTNVTYKGDNSACGAGAQFATCCKADFNQSGTVTVQDIFDFLAAYFGGSPLADINGAGGVTVQDIFDFLAAYFTGCT